ncbi:hypothetical protein BGZ65_010927 [Modicella reniformis]|uniref:Uncharacterized protein n=1 Tax=Modicella reniformis TaxID=1440133 RepID=A0A9P6MDK9_9FUNG|nr:hypothetical protein BGZ65_010927 [Modicella reniformis]
MLETMLHAVGDKKPAMDALLELAAADPRSSTSKDPNPLLTMPTDHLVDKIPPFIRYYVLENGSSAFMVLALLENPEAAEKTRKLLLSKTKDSSITLQKEMGKLIKGKLESELKAVRLILDHLAK